MNLNQKGTGSKKPKKQTNLESEIEKSRINKDWENVLKLVSSYTKLQEGTLDPILEPVVLSEHYIETGRAADAKLMLAKVLDKNPDDEVCQRLNHNLDLLFVKLKRM